MVISWQGRRSPRLLVRNRQLTHDPAQLGVSTDSWNSRSHGDDIEDGVGLIQHAQLLEQLDFGGILTAEDDSNAHNFVGALAPGSANVVVQALHEAALESLPRVTRQHRR